MRNSWGLMWFFPPLLPRRMSPERAPGLRASKIVTARGRSSGGSEWIGQTSRDVER